MDWQEALLARLTDDAGVTALVGEKVFWGDRSQDQPLPAVTLLTISDGNRQHLKGFESIQPARVQIDCWAASFSIVTAIKTAVLAALIPGYEGHGHRFARGDVVLAPRDLIERVSAGPDGRTKSINRVSMDLIFYHAPSEEELS